MDQKHPKNKHKGGLDESSPYRIRTKFLQYINISVAFMNPTPTQDESSPYGRQTNPSRV
jgi:hypothetical protein